MEFVGRTLAGFKPVQFGARLLRESNRNVATIARAIGDDSEAALSRAFRRIVDMPPATWRKAQTRTQRFTGSGRPQCWWR